MVQTTTESDIRSDLVRRLFAVAISIGVGSAIVGADWVKNPHFPNSSETQQIAIVILSLYATVLSWDGYLISISKKPLCDRGRFIIDISLVFTYMFLLVTSKSSIFWLPTFCFIFLLYFLWDILTIRLFPNQYNFRGSGTSSWPSVLYVYCLSFIDDRNFDRGPISTLIWGMYFASLYLLSLRFPNFGVLPACLFAGVGIHLYRLDKRYKEGDLRGFPMIRRLLTAGALFTIAGVWGRHAGS